MTLEEDKGIQRTNPRHRRSTRQRRANGVIPSPTRLSAGGADYMARRIIGSSKGKMGSVSPFLPFFSLFLLLLHRNTHPRVLFFRPLSPSYTRAQLFRFFPSGFPLCFPRPLSALGSVETPALPYLPEMPKMGTQLLDRGPGSHPCTSHPLPLQTALLPHMQLILNQ